VFHVKLSMGTWKTIIVTSACFSTAGQRVVF